MERFISVLVLSILPLIGPSLVLSGGFVLWRTRQRESRWSLAGSLTAVLGVALLIGTVWLLPDICAPVRGPVNRLVERVTRETPQAKVSSFLALAARGNQERALALWPASERLGAEYELRRQSVTAELAAMGPGMSHRVLRIEWWSNCCEPHVIGRSRDAGFARLWVEVSNESDTGQYVFDATTKGTYWGEMMGYPVRHWQILEIYPEGEKPLVWQWPS